MWPRESRCAPTAEAGTPYGSAGCWEHALHDENDLARHVDYIHFNPVKHGMVAEVADWPYSSFHHYVRQGRLPRSWSAATDETAAQTGEREER